MADALRRAIENPPDVPGVGVSSPLSGLRRRSVGFVDVLSQSVAAVAPSAAAATMPLLVSRAAGSATFWAIGAAMILALLVGATVNVFARRMAGTGSLYTFVARGLGSGASFFTGVALTMGYGVVSTFTVLGAGYYLTIVVDHFVPGAASTGVLVALILVTGVVCVVVLARGIRFSARLTLLIEVAAVTLIVVLVAVLTWVTGTDVEWSTFGFDGVEPRGFLAGAAIGLTAFVGFESATTLGVEARRPFANIPKALLATVLVAGAIFLATTFSQQLGFAALGLDMSASSSAVNDLASSYGIGWVGLLLDLSIAFSFLACSIASMTALVRVLFSMSRDGLVPARLGRTHPRYQTPIAAILVAVPVVTVVPLVLVLITGNAWDAMQFSLVCAATGYILSYILVCVAAPVFLARIGELTWWPVVRAILGAVLLSMILVVYLWWETSGPRGAGAIAAIIALSLTAGCYVLWVRRQLPRRVGSYDETVKADLLTTSGR